MTVTYFTTVPLIALLGVACLGDIKERRIPNALTLGGAGLALLLHAYSGGAAAFALSLAGWIVGLGCFLPLYLFRGMAAGDVKLMGMVGAFLGPLPAVLACALALIAGSAVGVIFFLLQQMQPYDDAQGEERVASGAGVIRFLALSSRLEQVPYAVAIGIGAVAVLVAPQMLEQLLGVKL